MRQVIDELRPIYMDAYEGPVIERDTPAREAEQRINDWVTSVLLRLLFDLANAKLDLIQVAGGNGGECAARSAPLAKVLPFPNCSDRPAEHT